MNIYKLIENKENPEDQMIEKSGFTHEFTVTGVQTSYAQIEKAKRELKAQKELEEAKMSNIADHHPYVLELDEEKRNAVYLYHQAFATAKAVEMKMAEVEDAEAETNQALADIEEQTGLKIQKFAPIVINTPEYEEQLKAEKPVEAEIVEEVVENKEEVK